MIDEVFNQSLSQMIQILRTKSGDPRYFLAEKATENYIHTQTFL